MRGLHRVSSSRPAETQRMSNEDPTQLRLSLESERGTRARLVSPRAWLERGELRALRGLALKRLVMHLRRTWRVSSMVASAQARQCEVDNRAPEAVPSQVEGRVTRPGSDAAPPRVGGRLGVTLRWVSKGRLDLLAPVSLRQWSVI